MIYMFNNRFSLLLVVFLVFFGANFGMYVEKPYINNEMWKKLIATFNYNSQRTDGGMAVHTGFIYSNYTKDHWVFLRSTMSCIMKGYTGFYCSRRHALF